MRKCPVCEENVPDEAKSCQVCGELFAPILKDFVCSSPIKASVIPIWVIISAISANALIVGFWLGSMVNWNMVKWHISLHWV